MKKLLIAMLVICAAAMGAEMVLQPGPDTGMDAAFYEDTPDVSYGDLSFMRLRYYMYDEGSTHNRNAVIMFDLSSIEDATINSAELQLYILEASATAPDYGYIAPCDRTWDETSATWNRLEDRYIDDEKLSMPAWPTAGSYSTVDVTSIVQDWVNSAYPNYGFYIWLDYEEPAVGDQASLKVAACEYVFDDSYWPKLTVDYDAADVEPASWGQIKALQ
jgi:hypothetical protein